MGNDDDKKIRLNYKYKKYKGKYLQSKIVQIGGNVSDLNNWVNQTGPVEVYPILVQRYGKPDIIANTQGGMCVWLNKVNIYPHEQIILKDEYIKHSKPKDHYDFLYSFIKVYIPPEKYIEIQKISGSISYDFLTRHLRARCASLEANFATFKTVFDTLNEVPSDYSINIGKRDEKMRSNESYIIDQIKKNNEQYANELTLPYYPLNEIIC